MQKQPFCQMNTFQNAFKNEYKVKQVSKIEQMLFAQSIKWIISAEQYIFETIQQLKNWAMWFHVLFQMYLLFRDSS